MTENMPRELPHHVQFSGSRALRWGAIVLILATLAYLLIPSLGTPRWFDNKIRLTNNLKQTGLALLHYHDTYGSFPPAYVVDSDGQPLYSWRVLVLPFMEENELYDQFHLDEPWSSEHNRSLLTKIPETYQSPYLKYNEQSHGMTPIRGIVDEHKWRTILRPQNGITLDEIPDGAGNTGLAIADPAHLVEWTKPEDIDLMTLLLLDDLDSTTLNGVMVVYGEARVRVLDQSNWQDFVGLFYCDDNRVPK